MITAIHIENFKGIRDRVKVDLKPITLLFGPNSAGKSMIVQAVHYAREILEPCRSATPPTKTNARGAGAADMTLADQLGTLVGDAHPWGNDVELSTFAGGGDVFLYGGNAPAPEHPVFGRLAGRPSGLIADARRLHPFV